MRWFQLAWRTQRSLSWTAVDQEHGTSLLLCGTSCTYTWSFFASGRGPPDVPREPVRGATHAPPAIMGLMRGVYHLSELWPILGRSLEA